MRRKLKITFILIFVAVNFILVLAMIFCAYSIFYTPRFHPNISFFGMIFPAFALLNFAFVVFWLIVKRRFVFIPVMGLMTCGWALRTFFPINFARSQSGANLKVVTYNIMNMLDVPKNALPEDNPIVRYLIDSDADIICLQEAHHIGDEQNMRLLHETYPYIENVISASNFMAILSKHPILETVNLYDSTVENRTFAFKVKFEEDTLLVINNHFESFRLNDEDKAEYVDMIEHPQETAENRSFIPLMKKVVAATAKRAPQADYLDAYVRDCNEKNIILCGDFNDTPLSYVHRVMTRHLNDAYTRGGNGYGNTYNRNGMYFRIDNILVSDNMTPCFTVVDKSIDTSDHYPLVSWLKLTK